ncbi:hypothetical protein FIBSPDRAFT_369879 [Athelia psychrophila]|uniref:Uncharacterized protein n=1 Tax=Athelia psychrophila TaxID=1759441 RepID=A0A167VHB5_9AGAM|nr:hypothetical protein FIBSPDRAFT_369879 [Fibularhizoctonia sp. CBS 109695]
MTSFPECVWTKIKRLPDEDRGQSSSTPEPLPHPQNDKEHRCGHAFALREAPVVGPSTAVPLHVPQRKHTNGKGHTPVPLILESPAFLSPSTFSPHHPGCTRSLPRRPGICYEVRSPLMADHIRQAYLRRTLHPFLAAHLTARRRQESC